MFEIIQFDVSGICNAKCSWCISGRRNRECNNSGGGFMSPSLFRDVVQHLKKEGFIAPNGWLALYMWGDPFLHPKIKEIMSIAHKENVWVGISTNGSKKVLFDEPGVLSNVRSIWFSMPGFSQDSYDKSHGFNFEKIKQNIVEMTHNFYEVGKLRPGGVVNIFHMYQYNLLEMPAALNFAKSNHAAFWPYGAAINDPELCFSYLKKEWTYEMLDKASRELFLTVYDKTACPSSMDAPHQCNKQLYLDEYANAVVCCNGKHIKLGSIFDMTPADYVRAKRENVDAFALCEECNRLGAADARVLQMQEIIPIFQA